jgi:hypothetical protein
MSLRLIMITVAGLIAVLILVGLVTGSISSLADISNSSTSSNGVVPNGSIF